MESDTEYSDSESMGDGYTQPVLLVFANAGVTQGNGYIDPNASDPGFDVHFDDGAPPALSVGIFVDVYSNNGALLGHGLRGVTTDGWTLGLA